MALYSAANRTTSNLANSAAIEVIAAASVPARLLEIGYSLTSATAGVLGFGVPQASGVTPGGLVTLIAEDQNGPAGNTRIAVSWGTGPTRPLTFLRQQELAGAIGNGVVWTFPLGLVLPRSQTVIIWNVLLSSLLDAWVVADE